MKKLAQWKVKQINDNFLSTFASKVDFEITQSIVTRKGKRAINFVMTDLTRNVNGRTRGTQYFYLEHSDPYMIYTPEILMEMIKKLEEEYDWGLLKTLKLRLHQ